MNKQENTSESDAVEKTPDGGAKEYRKRSQIPARERERVPSKTSGWRELKQHADKIRGSVKAASYSVWYRNSVMAVSELTSRDDVTCWHLSLAGNGRRSTDAEVHAALVCFGMTGAEEFNDNPAGARNFWMRVP